MSEAGRTTMPAVGTRVVDRSGPRCDGRLGTVVRVVRAWTDELPSVLVQWDGLKRPQAYWIGFLEPAPDAVVDGLDAP